jgi:uncharacterized membrane protein YidH (DUF202 family)
MGVRIAPGASPGEVVWLVLRQSLTMILVGVAVDIFAAALREGVRSVEPLAFAIMVAIVALAGLFASWLPASHQQSRPDYRATLRMSTGARHVHRLFSFNLRLACRSHINFF